MCYNALGLIPVGPEPRAFGVWGIIYFVSFVIIGALVMVNLFIGIVLTNLTEAQAEVLREKLHLPDVDEDSAIQGSLERIEKELIELRQRLGTVMAKGRISSVLSLRIQKIIGVNCNHNCKMSEKFKNSIADSLEVDIRLLPHLPSCCRISGPLAVRWI